MRPRRRSSLVPRLLAVLALAGCSAGIGSELPTDETDQAEKGGGQQRAANRLAKETSPYLLLHAHNPVDWYPWGPEAFETAKKEEKPIFLSIGYSSCYWCHVMERLVFENEKIAKFMNEHFVCVKVDREERPDVDDIYMTALLVYFQATGSKQGGGWPLSMFLTPEGKPIAGCTYFPPEAKNGLPGFLDVLKTVDTAWTDNRKAVGENAELLARETNRLMRPRLSLEKVELERKLVANAAAAALASYDREHGGLDFDADAPAGPKFPVPTKLALLHYVAERDGDPQDHEAAAAAVRHTLDEIVRGGIRDHLGGGFHRYSTDRAWHVPHFEKMLYDQAQLAEILVDVYRTTGDEAFRRAAEDTYGFVLREMTSKDGGFHSALDAETDGVEGQYYVWSKDEIREVLGAADAELFSRVYGLNEPQGFEHGYVLRLPLPLAKVAESLGTTPAALDARLEPMRRKLLAARERREPLLEDDKILTSWNGLMIRSLARSGKRLGRDDYVDAAARAAMFLLSTVRDDQGRLLRTHRDGQSKLNAYLDDYAFLVEGLLALHEATGDEKWLNAARRLTDQQIELFWDETAGGFFFTPHHHEELLARTKNAHDAVLPAGNSVSVRNLVRLASLTGSPKYREHAEKTLRLFAPELKQRPRSLATMAIALGEFLDDTDHASPDADPKPVDTDSAGTNGAGTDDAMAAAEGVILQTAAGQPAGQEKPKEKEIVTAQAFLNVDKLPAGSTCRVVLFVDVKQGWHVNQNPAVPENLIPTKFTVKSRQGVTLEDLIYPKGQELKVEGFDEPARVYEGRVAIYGTLRIPAEAAGPTDEIEISLRYQPCNDQQCLAPKTVKLSGRVPIARPGEEVRLINQNLFSKAGNR
jgi:uncharacterized protein YyaL (SSP411 family)